jgi:hypothetical protein
LAERGFDVRELNVGWKEWKAEGLPTEAGRVESTRAPPEREPREGRAKAG